MTNEWLIITVTIFILWDQEAAEKSLKKTDQK